MTKEQIAILFDRDRSVISRHINNIYGDNELDILSTCAESAQVQFEGARQVKHKIKIYNLDMIIAVGYRVNSKRGTQFRKWANNILKEYLLNASFGFVEQPQFYKGEEGEKIPAILEL